MFPNTSHHTKRCHYDIESYLHFIVVVSLSRCRHEVPCAIILVKNRVGTMSHERFWFFIHWYCMHTLRSLANMSSAGFIALCTRVRRGLYQHIPRYHPLTSVCLRQTKLPFYSLLAYPRTPQISYACGNVARTIIVVLACLCQHCVR